MKRHRRQARGKREGAAGLRIGDLVEVEVERILPGGLGFAHARGQTLMVALSAPGDRARVRVRSTKGRVAFASVEEVLAPGPARTEPPCPYFGRCGGCDFQQLTYEAQLRAKSEIVRDCLRRVAGVAEPGDVPVTPSPAVWRYRSRAQWQYDRGSGALGYFERGSHRICDVVECPVAAPAVGERLASLRAAAHDDALPREASEFQAVAGDDGVGLVPPVAEEDARELVRRVAGETYRFDASCFFQINHALLDALVREGLGDADAGIGPAAGRTALDLYCGVGLFTLPLARRFTRVVGVEGHPAACAYARRNLSDAGLSNAAVETSPVGAWLTRHADSLDGLDLVLLDPPRTGAEPETIAALTTLRPARITYVSCDPATLARDLRPLLAADYTLASIRAFDMFPQTHHVETVVHLTRPY